MWSVETAYELIAVFVSSTGVLGLGVSAVLAFLLRRAKSDAEQKHAERIQLELQRLEGEEKLSAVVNALASVALARHVPGEKACNAACSAACDAACDDALDAELDAALRDYREYLTLTRRARDEMLSRYTVK